MPWSSPLLECGIEETERGRNAECDSGLRKRCHAVAIEPCRVSKEVRVLEKSPSLEGVVLLLLLDALHSTLHQQSGGRASCIFTGFLDRLGQLGDVRSAIFDFGSNQLAAIEVECLVRLSNGAIADFGNF